MRLRVLIGARRLNELARPMIDVVVALGRTVNAIGPVQPGVEPLRAIGGRHLVGQHEAHFVEKGAGVVFLVKIAALPAPIGPGSSQAVKDLARAGLAHVFGVALEGGERVFVGRFPP